MCCVIVNDSANDSTVREKYVYQCDHILFLLYVLVPVPSMSISGSVARHRVLDVIAP